MEEVAGVGRLAASTPSHQYDGLVKAGGQHLSISYLCTGIDVWGHVLGLTAPEHLDYLQKHTQKILIVG